jgi:isopentenyldiphosphate isomerase
MGLAQFSQGLTAADWQALRHLQGAACQQPPIHFLPFYLGKMRVGRVPQERAKQIADALAAAHLTHDGLYWQADQLSYLERSQELKILADHFHQSGLITGWRGEDYEFFSPGSALSAQPNPLFRLERAAFRFFGLQSQAVHINGFDAMGRMWCGRRALNKATDPGRLDNLAAGGLTAGESIQSCAARELAEEAGLSVPVCGVPQAAGAIVTCRPETEGWHDEILWVFNLDLTPGTIPANTDGEVSGFDHFDAAEVMQRIHMNDYSIDAACVIAQGLIYEYQRMTGQPFSRAI